MEHLIPNLKQRDEILSIYRKHISGLNKIRIYPSGLVTIEPEYPNELGTPRGYIIRRDDMLRGYTINMTNTELLFQMKILQT